MGLLALNNDHMQSYALMDISLDTFPYPPIIFLSSFPLLFSVILILPLFDSGQICGYYYNVWGALDGRTRDNTYWSVPRSKCWYEHPFFVLFPCNLPLPALSTPSITLLFFFFANSPTGATLLTRIGYKSWICGTKSMYIETAVALASSPGALAKIRSGLRNRMVNSPLCDGKLFTQVLEQTYRSKWQVYVDKRKMVERSGNSMRSVLVGEDGPPRGTAIRAPTPTEYDAASPLPFEYPYTNTGQWLGFPMERWGCNCTSQDLLHFNNHHKKNSSSTFNEVCNVSMSLRNLK